MRLEHKFVVPAPVEQTWAAFNDLERVVPCFPGATLTSYEGDEFIGSCKVKLGPVSLQYSGNGTFVERDPADHHAVIEAKGKDRRGNGTATARVTARLVAAGPDSTEVTVETDLTITGRPAQFGRGLIQDVSNKLLDQFTTCLTTKLDTPAEAPPTPPAATAAPTPGQSNPASSQSNPASSQSNPASSQSNPASSQSNPASSQSNPASSQSNPASSQSNPASSQSNPASSQSNPASSRSDSAARDAGSAPPDSDAVALDLVGTVLPALARRIAPYLIGAVLALALRRLLGRR
ncbi:SRPBCC domain-containing protein [Kribbella sp. NBC_00709]|uniref:SRPBCC domain-containing protein n=1 Tax=Kribbella sp. NBC_00709 TaxID=2975972 RepID=UPI002E2A2C88|nr:SRPBCC domain-containing protein [Kribbella sp. NBC_00709]